MICWIWVRGQQWMGFWCVNLCVCKWNIFHNGLAPLSIKTRPTRTHAFWGYPPPPHDYPYYWVILDPKSKEDKVKATHSNNLPFFFNYETSFTSYNSLMLLDKMCKYKMDPLSIGEDTERTRFCPQTDRRARWNQYTLFQLRWSGGYNEGVTCQSTSD